jgi:hypothetical protein
LGEFIYLFSFFWADFSLDGVGFPSPFEWAGKADHSICLSYEEEICKEQIPDNIQHFLSNREEIRWYYMYRPCDLIFGWFAGYM